MTSSMSVAKFVSRTTSRLGRLAAAVLAIAVSTAALPSTAKAEWLLIAGTGLVLRSDDALDTAGTAENGVLQNAKGKFYAPVVFPNIGDRVCRFAMVFRDFDTDVNVTARLLRKPFVAGGNAFSPPVVMAALTSAGAVDGVRRLVDTTISNPALSLTSFYSVEVEMESTLQLVGLQIDVRPTCP